MDYVILKIIAAVILFIGTGATGILGRKRQSPFYFLWSLFLFSYGVFEIFDYFEFRFQTTLWYRLFQVSQSLAIILLFAACLEQSMILPSRSSRILTAALFATSVYFIIIPLETMMESYKSITIYLLHIIPTDIYGFWYGLLIIVSAACLVPSVIRLFRITRRSKEDKRPVMRRNSTILVILMLIGLAIITVVRREMSKRAIEAFFYIDTIYSITVTSLIAIYQAMSLSHGVQTILLVDLEGNPLVGYSPKERREISYEEKIVAASGYLSGLFHFVKYYVSEKPEEQFRQLKTTTSTLSFYTSNHFFLIVQSKIVSDMLDRLSKHILEQIDEYLQELKVNEIPSREQKNYILALFDKNFYLLA
ncbi:MAG: hypothetical protein ACTSYD_03905 [Candidatus Heimdallarchaeaceae archaeon]